jgi:hypothetical protein
MMGKEELLGILNRYKGLLRRKSLDVEGGLVVFAHVPRHTCSGL